MPKGRFPIMSNNCEQLNAISLFSGAGGLDIGFAET